jgi:hypothetical protein
MKNQNQQTYSVVDTDTGSLIGSGLTYEQKNRCLLLGELHLTVYREAPSLIAYDYELTTQHNNNGEYSS